MSVKKEKENDDIKQQIIKLKKIISDTKKERFSLIDKKHKYLSELNEKISFLRDFKELRRKNNEKIDEVKKDLLEEKKKQKEIKNKIKELNLKRKKVLEKAGLKENPKQIEDLIKKTEFMLQTQPMSLSKEQENRKKIKDLKQKLSKTGEVSTIIEEMNKHKESSKEVLQKIAVHNKIIKSLISEIRSMKDNVNGVGDKLDAIRVHIDEINKEINEKEKVLKENYNALQKLDSSFKSSLSQARKENKEKKEQEKKRLDEEFNEKKKIVLEKIKNGDKLNTDDLMIYQRIMIEK